MGQNNYLLCRSLYERNRAIVTFIKSSDVESGKREGTIKVILEFEEMEFEGIER